MLLLVSIDLPGSRDAADAGEYQHQPEQPQIAGLAKGLEHG